MRKLFFKLNMVIPVMLIKGKKIPNNHRLFGRYTKTENYLTLTLSPAILA